MAVRLRHRRELPAFRVLANTQWLALAVSLTIFGFPRAEGRGARGGDAKTVTLGTSRHQFLLPGIMHRDVHLLTLSHDVRSSSIVISSALRLVSLRRR
jgi:hypothetical protein